jgi:hypothetical protein
MLQSNFERKDLEYTKWDEERMKSNSERNANKSSSEDSRQVISSERARENHDKNQQKKLPSLALGNKNAGGLDKFEFRLDLGAQGIKKDFRREEEDASSPRSEEILNDSVEENYSEEKPSKVPMKMAIPKLAMGGGNMPALNLGSYLH